MTLSDCFYYSEVTQSVRITSPGIGFSILCLTISVMRRRIMKLFRFPFCNALVGLLLAAQALFSLSFFEPNAENLRIIGRCDTSGSKAPRFGWPGVYIEGRFSGSSCRIILQHVNAPNSPPDTPHTYLKIIDDRIRGRTDVSNGIDTSVMAQNLDAGVHTFRLYRITEAVQSYAQLQGLLLDDTASLLPVEEAEKRILFIGDSHTAGFGAGDTNEQECLHSEYNSYAARIARHFGAAHHNISVSGKALMQSPWYTDPKIVMPNYFNRTLAYKGTPKWDHLRWLPQLTVVNLGTNDYHSYKLDEQNRQDPLPNDEEFKQEYHAFLDTLRDKYPNTSLILVGPFDSCGARDKAKKVVDEVYREEISDGTEDIFYCAYPPYDDLNDVCCHPSASFQKVLSDKCIALIEDSIPLFSSHAETRHAFYSSEFDSRIRLIEKNGRYIIESTRPMHGLEIYRINGTLVSQKTLHTPGTRVRLSHLPHGIYLIRGSDNARTWSERIMIIN